MKWMVDIITIVLQELTYFQGQIYGGATGGGHSGTSTKQK
jgi:hypothetical protein